MNKDSTRFAEYNSNGSYRGFKVVSCNCYRLSHYTHLIFSNGERSIYSAGGFVEEALTKMFDKIDDYYASKDMSKV